jgi:hypothetical protein
LRRADKRAFRVSEGRDFLAERNKEPGFARRTAGAAVPTYSVSDERVWKIVTNICEGAVVKKKAQRGKKSPAKSTAKISEGRAKKRVNMERVREDIDRLVWRSAKAIAEKVIEGAKGGQVAAAKYLFELAGLFPVTEETRARAPQDSLPYMLLKRMGLPTEAALGEVNDRAETDPDRDRDEGQDIELGQPELEPSVERECGGMRMEGDTVE